MYFIAGLHTAHPFGRIPGFHFWYKIKIIETWFICEEEKYVVKKNIFGWVEVVES